MWSYVVDAMRGLFDSFVYRCLETQKDVVYDASFPNGTCDVYVGSMHDNLMSSREVLNYSVPYGAAGISALAGRGKPSPVYQSWSWLFPFDTWMWFAVLGTIFVIPLMSAVLEKDPGETWFDSYWGFLADSWHAITDVDSLKRTMEVNDLSAALSVLVALFAKIVTAVYACNLASFVLFMTYNPSPYGNDVFAYTRGYLSPYVPDPKEIVDGEFNSTVIAEVEASRAIVVSDTMEISHLRTRNTLVINDYTNASVLISAAFPKMRYDGDIALAVDSFVTRAAGTYFPWKWWSWYSTGNAPSSPAPIGMSSIWGLFACYFVASSIVVLASRVVPACSRLFSRVRGRGA
jgi:hypothetical protein